MEIRWEDLEFENKKTPRVSGVMLNLQLWK